MKPIYLDYAATTPVDPEVRAAMLPYLEANFGNPSSGHRPGQQALEGLENARTAAAQLIHAAPEEIVFTSGGTESDNAAIKSACLTQKHRGNHLITAAFEHHGILHPCEFMERQGYRVTYLPVGSDGIVDPDAVKKAMTDQTILISVMHANNEIGTVQPIAEIGKLARERDILFHTDAVQTAGHLPLDVGAMHIDLLSLSAHKFYGPKGAGVLYIRKEIPFEPLLHGGGHEKGRRSSTHNMPGIAGLGRAAGIALAGMPEETRHVTALRNRLWENLQNTIPDISLNGSLNHRLPNNLNISIAHVEGESLLMNLDMEGIAASSGSACSSDSGDISHVLKALGLQPELARGSLRLTLGKYTTEEEIAAVSEILPRVVTRLRAMAAY